MEENVTFDKIDKDTENVFEIDTDKEKNTEAFVLGLPDWDLEPLYESLDRGDVE